jgi:hypothetical protein
MVETGLVTGLVLLRRRIRMFDVWAREWRVREMVVRRVCAVEERLLARVCWLRVGKVGID